MKKFLMLLAVPCIAGTVLATDIVLDVKLNGLALEEDGKKSAKILTHNVLVIEDVNAETNVFAGTLYLLDAPSAAKAHSNNGNKKTNYFETEDVAVRIISTKHREFALLVELDDAVLAGIGKITRDQNGDISQINISSGQGVFLHTGYVEEDTTIANSEEDTLEELEAGKMSARLNKTLTDAAVDSDGNTVVEDWLESRGYTTNDTE